MSHPAPPVADSRVCPGCFEPLSPLTPARDLVEVGGFVVHAACIAKAEGFDVFAVNVGYTRMTGVGRPSLEAPGREFVLTPSPVAVSPWDVVLLPDGRAFMLADAPPVDGLRAYRWLAAPSPLPLLEEGRRHG